MQDARAEPARAGPDVRLAQHVPEAGLLVAEELAGEIERAATAADEPAALAPASAPQAPLADPIRSSTLAESRYELRSRLGRAQIEHAAHAIAVAHGVSAGRQRRAVERERRHEGERVVVVLEMEGVVELLAVEQDAHLVAAPTMDAELRRHVVGGDAGKSEAARKRSPPRCGSRSISSGSSRTRTPAAARAATGGSAARRSLPRRRAEDGGGRRRGAALPPRPRRRCAAIGTLRRSPPACSAPLAARRSRSVRSRRPRRRARARPSVAARLLDAGCPAADANTSPGIEAESSIASPPTTTTRTPPGPSRAIKPCGPGSRRARGEDRATPAPPHAHLGFHDFVREQDGEAERAQVTQDLGERPARVLHPRRRGRGGAVRLLAVEGRPGRRAQAEGHRANGREG